MKHALTGAVPVMTALFLLVAVPNYAAMGNDIAGCTLLCAQSTVQEPLYPCTDVFDSYSSPVVPIVIANLCVVLHLVAAYAMFSAPVFALVEASVTKSAKLSNKTAIAFRVIWRICYIATLGLLGGIAPFFSSIVGLVGGLSFWPLAVGLVRCMPSTHSIKSPHSSTQPIAMWSAKHKPRPRTRTALNVVSALCLVVSILAVAGSIEGIVAGFSTYSIGF